ncbi:MAG: hypothetical protein GX964_10670 [Syntrophomonadaceae bacterium]|nr:hypothetical protein [Syntrophomonadaceae bacterium]
MKIIDERRRIEKLEYYRVFEYENHPGAGFSFPCDAQGRMHSLNKDARINLARCLVSDEGLQDLGIKTYRHTYMEPAVGLCTCGEKVKLSSFTNTCRCGRDYNFAGSELAPRSQWGAETGESWWECY